MRTSICSFTARSRTDKGPFANWSALTVSTTPSVAFGSLNPERVSGTLVFCLSLLLRVIVIAPARFQSSCIATPKVNTRPGSGLTESQTPG